jgi:hypothetical protein
VEGLSLYWREERPAPGAEPGGGGGVEREPGPAAAASAGKQSGGERDAGATGAEEGAPPGAEGRRSEGAAWEGAVEDGDLVLLPLSCLLRLTLETGEA